ncbi:MAG: hypothetical protein R2939_13155 [Kofleriaceae bacterium]
MATSVTGDVTAWAPAASVHAVRIDIESLPTGTAMPSACASSLAARTAA